MQPLVDVPPDQLPTKFRALVDPDQPLAQPEHFLPTPFDGVGGQGFAAVITGGLTAAGVYSLYNAITTHAEHSAIEWLFIGFFPLALAGITVWILIQLARQPGQIRAHQAGRYRRGVFFLPDAALLHDGKRCTLLPRDAIRAVYPKVVSHGKTQSEETFADLVGPDGQVHPVHVHSKLWLPEINQWYERGEPPRIVDWPRVRGPFGSKPW